MSESELRKIYEEKVEFLTECDNIKEELWSLERWEAFDYAIAQYELLCKILGIELKWVT